MSHKPLTFIRGQEPQAKSPLTFDYDARRGVHVALWKGMEIGVFAFDANHTDKARIWKQQVAATVSNHAAMECWKL